MTDSLRSHVDKKASQLAPGGRDPQTKAAAGRVSRQRYEGLVAAIRDVMGRAIKQGGTTLRDFVNSEGDPGYFAQELLVYDRAGSDCFQCGAPIRQKVIGQRSSYYCPACQR